MLCCYVESEFLNDDRFVHVYFLRGHSTTFSLAGHVISAWTSVGCYTCVVFVCGVIKSVHSSVCAFVQCLERIIIVISLL